MNVRAKERPAKERWRGFHALVARQSKDGGKEREREREKGDDDVV